MEMDNLEVFKIPGLPQVAPNSTSGQIKDATPEIKEPEIKPVVEVCPYKIPPWSTNPPADIELKFEILKSGQIIGEVEHLEKKATWTFGRLPQNDIEMAHPTISRFHAVLQYRPPVQLDNNTETDKSEPPEGWYIYDLGSTHGTFLNKQRLPARVFIRMHVGHMLKLGTSSRIFILQGPAEFEEPESEFTVTELRAQRKAKQLKAAAEAQARAELEEARSGVSWGMSEDADEETDLQHNPFAVTTNEELFLEDPKRTLRGYFEREGLVLEYKCDEMSPGTFVCRVELPIDDENGRPIVTEVVHKGRKKECVAQCALESCRILDRHGVLRQANKEPLKRRTKPEESDSDDEFLDRTGDVARKKQRKMNSINQTALTHEDLLKKEAEIVEQLNEMELKIANYHEKQKQLKEVAKAQEASADLDAYMDVLSEDQAVLDKTEIRKLRLEQQRLKLEQEKTKRLLKITQPADIPFIKDKPSNADGDVVSSSKTIQVKKQLPLIGKRNQFSKFKFGQPKTVIAKPKREETLASDEEEEEIEDDNDNDNDNEDKDKESKKEKIEIQDSSKDNSAVTTKVHGPAIIKEQIKESEELVKSEEITEKNKNIEGETSDNGTKCEEKIESVAQKEVPKKRQRLRHYQRNREDINTNELEEHESTDKYAKWVPPENQKGDGFTKLNDKYGY